MVMVMITSFTVPPSWSERGALLRFNPYGLRCTSGECATII